MSYGFSTLDGWRITSMLIFRVQIHKTISRTESHAANKWPAWWGIQSIYLCLGLGLLFGGFAARFGSWDCGTSSATRVSQAMDFWWLKQPRSLIEANWLAAKASPWTPEVSAHPLVNFGLKSERRQPRGRNQRLRCKPNTNKKMWKERWYEILY